MRARLAATVTDGESSALEVLKAIVDGTSAGQSTPVVDHGDSGRHAASLAAGEQQAGMGWTEGGDACGIAG